MLERNGFLAVIIASAYLISAALSARMRKWIYSYVFKLLPPRQTFKLIKSNYLELFFFEINNLHISMWAFIEVKWVSDLRLCIGDRSSQVLDQWSNFITDA